MKLHLTSEPKTGQELFFETLRDKLAELIGATQPPPHWVPWRHTARANQLPPEWGWFTWLLLAGRGFGKTRTGAEWIHEEGMAGNSQRYMALVARTPADARDIMLYGPGGLMTNAPPNERPRHVETKRLLIWPTGARATIYSGANPEQLRGFSGERAWVDELASYEYPQDTWDNLMFGMREAKVDDPRVVVTTTPRPIQVLKDLLKAKDDYVHVTTGSSYDNRANLSKRYYDVVIRPYEGTRLGRQEIYAELLEDVEGALWSLALLDRLRLTHADVPDLDQVCIAVDPAVTANRDSDETGISVHGRGWCKCQQRRNERGHLLEELHGFVLDDLSGIYRPERWADIVLSAFDDWEANFILGEVNNGGDLVARNIHAERPEAPFREVRASRNKFTRAEPISTLYERGRVHHVGTHAKLEDEMTSWVPNAGMPSPSRLDSVVWGQTKLMLESLHVIDGDLSNWGGYRPA